MEVKAGKQQLTLFGEEDGINEADFGRPPGDFVGAVRLAIDESVVDEWDSGLEERFDILGRESGEGGD